MEKLINPEVPDKRINPRQALAEIEQLIKICPELGTMLRLRLSRIYPCDT